VLLPSLDGQGARSRDAPLGTLEGLEGLQVGPERVRLQRFVQQQVVVGQRLDLPGGGNEVVGRVPRHSMLRLGQQVQLDLRKHIEVLVINLRALGFPVDLPLDLLELVVEVQPLVPLGLPLGA
jgi:hypothetical protein